jgi:anaerobic carbon-monoxide dehydrogenase iron sulfur subunit
METVFVNPERCVGCKQCQIACAVEHSRSKDLYQAVFESPRPQPRIYVSPGLYLNTSFPNKCRHCDPAPCMAVCPTAAITRQADGSIVLIDGNKCITCAMCAMVCPFDVIRYSKSASVRFDKIVALKCDQCVERRRRGELPACVEVCKAGALAFGDINELIRLASARLAKMVSIAAGEIRLELPRLPAHYEAWRAWGESVAQINQR